MDHLKSILKERALIYHWNFPMNDFKAIYAINLRTIAKANNMSRHFQMPSLKLKYSTMLTSSGPYSRFPNSLYVNDSNA